MNKTLHTKNKIIIITQFIDLKRLLVLTISYLSFHTHEVISLMDSFIHLTYGACAAAAAHRPAVIAS